MLRRTLKVLFLTLLGFDVLLLYHAFGLFPPHWPKQLRWEGATLHVVPIPWTMQDGVALALLLLVHLLILLGVYQSRHRRNAPSLNS